MAEKGILRRDGDKLILSADRFKKPRRVSPDAVTEALHQQLDEKGEVEIEFDFHNGQPRSCRLPGEAVPVRAPSRAPSSDRRRRSTATTDQFLNPYAFVPWVERDRLPDGLKDAPPVGHHRLDPERFTGTITVEMTAVTPLLLIDAARERDEAPGESRGSRHKGRRGRKKEEDDRHRTVDLSLDANGRPRLAPSAVKGMLRSAYEAITGSRFGVFSEAHHREALTYRERTNKGAGRRRPFTQSPWDQLPPQVRPASTIETLSAADRVFGWVSPSGDGAYGGHLRITEVHCQTEADDAVEHGSDGPLVTLAALSAPKPAQGRFYLARRPTPDDSDRGLSTLGKVKTADLYSTRTTLAGWKRYWHHADLARDWPPPGDLRAGQRYQDDEPDSQNTSVTGWVKPGCRFEVTLEVTNLHELELGALLWLLEQPEGFHHQIGYAKPLGFGSVRTRICTCQVATGRAWATYWSDLGTAQAPSDPQLQGRSVERFKREAAPTLERAWEAFLDLARGHSDVSVHYPRLPNQTGHDRLFEWFKANESGAKHSLPIPTAGKPSTLPRNPRN